MREQQDIPLIAAICMVSVAAMVLIAASSIRIKTKDGTRIVIRKNPKSKE